MGRVTLQMARRCVVAVVLVHGGIHLLGAVKGLGLVPVAQLQQPISAVMGVTWLLAALAVLAAGVLMAVRTPQWWGVAAVAAVGSQAVIVTSWSDARAGTVANVLLLAAATHGYASQGSRSLRAAYRREVAAALQAASIAAGGDVAAQLVTEGDLAHLPEAVADYVRGSGAVGRPRVRSFRARVHGRIRGGHDRPWMTFTAEQVNTFGAEPRRVFLLDATMSGLPVDVLHVFAARAATMRVRVCSLLPIVSAAGPDLDRAETVTLLNDLCVLAPAALVDADIDWAAVDANRVRAMFTAGRHRVSAELHFDSDHRLVDFVSHDRLRASTDGKAFVRQTWSTPVGGYRSFGQRRVAAVGSARWHAPEPEGTFTYLEIVMDDVTYAAPPEGPLEQPTLEQPTLEQPTLEQPTQHDAEHGGAVEVSRPS